MAQNNKELEEENARLRRDLIRARVEANGWYILHAHALDEGHAVLTLEEEASLKRFYTESSASDHWDVGDAVPE